MDHHGRLTAQEVLTLPECRNCGGHVSPDWLRVFFPDEVEEPNVCPACPGYSARQVFRGEQL